MNQHRHRRSSSMFSHHHPHLSPILVTIVVVLIIFSTMTGQSEQFEFGNSQINSPQNKLDNEHRTRWNSAFDSERSGQFHFQQPDQDLGRLSSLPPPQPTTVAAVTQSPTTSTTTTTTTSTTNKASTLLESIASRQQSLRRRNQFLEKKPIVSELPKKFTSSSAISSPNNNNRLSKPKSKSHNDRSSSHKRASQQTVASAPQLAQHAEQTQLTIGSIANTPVSASSALRDAAIFSANRGAFGFRKPKKTPGMSSSGVSFPAAMEATRKLSSKHQAAQQIKPVIKRGGLLLTASASNIRITRVPGTFAHTPKRHNRRSRQ